MAIFKFRNLKNGQATPIPAGEFTIGRAEDAYIHVEDSSISRHHARLLNNDQGFFVDDLGSANGIALNGAYVKGRTAIKLGDLVHIGTVPFRIDPEVAGEPSAAPSAGLRRIDRDYIRKETEPIPATSSGPLAKLMKKKAASGSLIRHSVPLPTLARLTESPSAAAETKAPEPAPLRAEAAPSADFETEEEDEYEENLLKFFHLAPWWWWMAAYLAGLGTGLVLALYFAKFFLEMGGKSLP